MRLTRIAVFASLWLLCVGAVGTASWYAIDSAGRTTQVLTSDNRAARPASAGTTPAAAPTSEETQPDASDDPSSQTSEPDDDPTSATTSASSSSTRPSDDGTQRPGTRTSSRPASPRPTRTTTSTTAAGARTMLQQTAGGSVQITCRAGEPIDYVAKPAQGWGVRSNTQGATEADIKFSDSDETFEVHAKCVDGEPAATVEHKSNDD